MEELYFTITGCSYYFGSDFIITDFKAIEPFTFDNRMKGFNACIIPRKSFLRVGDRFKFCVNV